MFALELAADGHVLAVHLASAKSLPGNVVLMPDVPTNLLDGSHQYRFLGSLVDVTGESKPAPAPTPERPQLRLISVAADEMHVARTRINLEAARVDSCVGAVLVAEVEILLSGVRLPLTDTFALPLLASDGREHLVEAVFENGLGQVRVPLTASGAWQVTEAEINKRLPAAMHMQFEGVAIYVVA